MEFREILQEPSGIKIMAQANAGGSQHVTVADILPRSD